jgi:hypothetical protein
MLKIYILVIISFVTSVVTNYYHTEKDGLAVRLVGLNSRSAYFQHGPAHSLLFPLVIVAEVSRVCPRPLENSKLVPQLGHNPFLQTVSSSFSVYHPTS